MSLGRIGFLCGLKSEAEALAIPGLAISGARPERAEAEASRLADSGAVALLSLGLAGALVPALAPGDLVVPEEVVAPGARWPCSRCLADRLGFPLSPLSLAGAEAVVASPGAKARLHRETGAAAVDMESHRLARVATARALPFLVIRVIADAADRTIPSAADGAIRADGSVDIGGTLFRLAARPWQLPALLALGRDSAAAHARLRDIGARLRQAEAKCPGPAGRGA